MRRLGMRMELVLLMTYSADLISPSGSLSHLFLPSRRSAAAAAAEPGTTFGPAGISEKLYLLSFHLGFLFLARLIFFWKWKFIIQSLREEEKPVPVKRFRGSEFQSSSSTGSCWLIGWGVEPEPAKGILCVNSTEVWEHKHFSFSWCTWRKKRSWKVEI